MMLLFVFYHETASVSTSIPFHSYLDHGGPNPGKEYERRCYPYRIEGLLNSMRKYMTTYLSYPLIEGS